MVVMLGAEDTSPDGPLASTPDRSTDCADKNPPKKLVQARLPFKRLNPEPKGTREPKRARVPSALPCHGNRISDGENEANDVSPPQCPRPAKINGRGPIDGFIVQKRLPSLPVVTIDLTEDSSSTPTIAQQQQEPPVPVPPASNGPRLDDHIRSDEPDKSCTISSRTALSDVKENGDAHIEEDDPDIEEDDPDIEEDDPKETVEERENVQEEDCPADTTQEAGLLSPAVSVSSLSTLESSPESTKTPKRTPSSTTDPDGTSETKVKRRSLKSVKEQEERQQQRAEKERQRMEAKAANEKRKLEARRLKEEKEKEKKEKKEKEERERREKKENEEKEKAEKLKAKTEERKAKQEAKQEEKRKKEEEKRMKEEEKKMKEEKDRIKAGKAEITRFLQKPKAQLTPKTLTSACGKFAPFEIKEHMLLAPLCRVQCENAVFEELDQYLTKPDRSASWLKDLTSRRPRSSGQTKSKHQESRSESLVVVKCPKTGASRARMKLLQFHLNHRPAYWGTWSKKSCCISARHPFQQDKELDYEVDSDEEWEEEEPGESLSHSEGDDDGEEGDDDDDDGFFVPHGYLSDGEGALEEEEGGDPAKQKLRQKLKAREWDELLSKKKVKVLEAVISGCLWADDGETGLSQTQKDTLQSHAIALLEPLPKDEPCSPENSPGETRRDELLPQLLPLLHGNVNSSKVIISEFQEFCRQQATSLINSPHSPGDGVPTRVGVKRLIKESAVYEKRSCLKRCCWYVHAEVLVRFGLESLPVPCKWNYLTPGIQQSRDDPQTPQANSQGGSPTTPQSTITTAITLSAKRKSAGGSMPITKFMKKCVDQEQTENTEADGFQADTEEDEKDDCVCISTESGSSTKNISSSSLQRDPEEPMEVGAPTAAPMASPSTTHEKPITGV